MVYKWRQQCVTRQENHTVVHNYDYRYEVKQQTCSSRTSCSSRSSCCSSRCSSRCRNDFCSCHFSGRTYEWNGHSCEAGSFFLGCCSSYSSTCRYCRSVIEVSVTVITGWLASMLAFA